MEKHLQQYQDYLQLAQFLTSSYSVESPIKKETRLSPNQLLQRDTTT